MKKENNATIIPKVFIIVSLSFLLKLFFSCTPNSQDPIKINYNHLSVTGIDNSGRYLNNHTSVDTLFSEALALKLLLSDTARLYTSMLTPKIIRALSFQTLKADDIAPSYIPENKVVDIQIKTLFDINDFIKAGDDVSEYFLCASSNDFDLYHQLGYGISRLNDVQSFYEGGSIILILNESIQNTQAQFEVKILLDDDSELLGTSGIFTIIES